MSEKSAFNSIKYNDKLLCEPDLSMKIIESSFNWVSSAVSDSLFSIIKSQNYYLESQNNKINIIEKNDKNDDQLLNFSNFSTLIKKRRTWRFSQSKEEAKKNENWVDLKKNSATKGFDKAKTIEKIGLMRKRSLSAENKFKQVRRKIFID